MMSRPGLRAPSRWTSPCSRFRARKGPRETYMRAIWRVLAGQRDLRLVLSAGLISLTGDWILRIGLLYRVYVLTGSTVASALAMMASFVPQVLLGPVAGVFADRWDRKQTMIVADLLLAAGLLPPRATWRRGSAGDGLLAAPAQASALGLRARGWHGYGAGPPRCRRLGAGARGRVREGGLTGRLTRLLPDPRDPQSILQTPVQAAVS